MSKVLYQEYHVIEKWKRLGQKVLLDLRIMKKYSKLRRARQEVAPHPFLCL